MRRWRLNLPLILGGAVLLGLVVVLLLPLFVKLDPDTRRLTDWVDGKLMVPPFAPGVNGHHLGTDAAGRDLLSRLVYGARLTLLAGGSITALRMLIAIPLGLVAGWKGGRLGYVTNLFSSSLSALPTLLLVIVLMSGMSVFVRGYATYLAVYLTVVTVVGIPRVAEQIRRLTDEIKSQPYIEAAVAAGAPSHRILLRHILPVIRGDVVVAMAAEAGWVLLLMGQLAFFGFLVAGDAFKVETAFGPGNPMEKTAEWAEMVGLNFPLFRSKTWVPLFPALALGTTVAGLQLLAEGLRQRWLHR